MAGFFGLDQRKRSEIVGILTIATALIVGLALFTYDPSDVHFNTTQVNSPRENLIGVPGAYLAYALKFVLGHASWLITVILIAWGIRGFRKPEKNDIGIRALGAVGLLISLCAILSVVFGLKGGTQAAWQAGGIIGSSIAHGLSGFNTVGSLILLFTVLCVSVVLSSEFLFTEFFRRVREMIHGAVGSTRENLANRREAARKRRAVRRAEAEARREEKSKADEDKPKKSKRRKKAEEAENTEDEPVEVAPDTGADPVIFLSEFPEQEQEPGVVLNVHNARVEESEKQPVESDTGEELYAEVLNVNRKLRKRKSKSTEIQQENLFEDLEEEVTDEVPALTDGEYVLPPLTLMETPRMNQDVAISHREMQENCEILTKTLGYFGINAKVTEVNSGPVITRYELEPPPGVKVNRIVGLADDIALALRATSVRIVAPIPGKAAVGVEIPNRNRSEVFIREICNSPEFQKNDSKLKIALGKTLSGDPYVADLRSMPHLLIAGATGAGKSVCVNSIISSILVQASPDEVKFLMIDPKRVELQLYADIPHLITPVVTNPKRAGLALKWVVAEMEQRYGYLARIGVREIRDYNKKIKKVLANKDADPNLMLLPAHLPYIVVLIDELADLMMVARADVETMVCRLAQMARAVGIHLVLTTQRPSVNVITGVIKANFPTRIAFQVSSKVDSRTIMDYNGAEALLGKGDMLYCSGGGGKPVRLQGSYISASEIELLTQFVKKQASPDYLDVNFDEMDVDDSSGGESSSDEDRDELYQEAVDVVLSTRSASTSLLQRRLKIGYGRAARILDIMQEDGIVGPSRGSKPREVYADSTESVT